MSGIGRGDLVQCITDRHAPYGIARGSIWVVEDVGEDPRPCPICGDNAYLVLPVKQVSNVIVLGWSPCAFRLLDPNDPEAASLDVRTPILEPA